MPRTTPRPYQLTTALVASSVGSGVLCLAAEGIGRTYRLHATRPGPERNIRMTAPLADLPSSAAHVIAPIAQSPALIRVDISGPIEQRAGHHDPCSGWTDGNDAISERLCAAFAEGDVELVIDTPGGAAAGAEQGIARALAAKARYGRRCTGFADEQIGSLGMWWALAICDELFIPKHAQLGSIGARAGHLDISAAMAEAGERLTYFTWPNDGKIALAPERPLSEVGKARGERDVAIIGEAFCAAVVGSAIGQRYGLTRERVIELGADMLTGQAAVDAGLADGVSTLEDVTAYALKQAERAASGPPTEDSARARTRGKRETMKHGVKGARAEDGPPEDAGAEPSGKCSSCGCANEMNAKFCDQCGASMAAAPLAEEPPPSSEEPGDEPPPSSKPPPPHSASSPPMAPGASFAEILGLPADASVPAQKAAAIELRQVRDHAAKLTGQKSASAIIGGLTAIAADAAASGRLRAERDELARHRAKVERWDLAKRLAALGVAGHDRGAIFIDAVNPDGSRKLDAAGKPIMKLTPMYAEMKLGTLRGLVEGHEKNAPRRDPFVADENAAREQAANAKRTGGLTTEARFEAAKKDPAVIKLAAQTGRPIEKVAAAWIETLDMQNGAR